ncbi:MAG: Restriction Enzyme Adenine Methylase Associated [Acidimicrobiaceae bacterium]
MTASSTSVLDLLRAGTIHAGEPIVMRRRSGPPREANVQADGTIVLRSGQVCRTLSEAAKEAAEVGSADGWLKWRVPRLDDKTFAALRAEAD